MSETENTRFEATTDGGLLLGLFSKAFHLFAYFLKPDISRKNRRVNAEHSRSRYVGRQHRLFCPMKLLFDCIKLGSYFAPLAVASYCGYMLSMNSMAFVGKSGKIA